MHVWRVLGGVLLLVAALQLAHAADVGRFWQVTDIHLDPWYVEGSDVKSTMCHNITGSRLEVSVKAGYAGDFLCYSAPSLVDATIQFLRASSANGEVDFVVWTGDQSPLNQGYPMESPDLALSQDRINEVTQSMTQLMMKAFPPDGPIPLFPTLGNHAVWKPSWLPATTHSHTRELLATLASLWQPWLPPDAVASFRTNGTYSAAVLPGLRVVALNTLYCDHWNVHTWDGETRADLERLWEWLDATLDSVRRAGERAILIGHVPLNGKESVPTCAEAYRKAARAYADVLPIQLFGHTHCDHWTVARDAKDGHAVGVQFIAPSVTPTSHKENGHNPALRLWEYDRETFELLDYTQYWVNLTKANEERKIEWEVEYVARTAYGLKSMNASAWMDLSERMAKDDETFDAVYAHYRTLYPEECGALCRREFVCNLQSLTDGEWLECMA